MKYICWLNIQKSVLWRVAKRLSYKQDARCLKVNAVNKLLLGINMLVLFRKNLCPMIDRDKEAGDFVLRAYRNMRLVPMYRAGNRSYSPHHERQTSCYWQANHTTDMPLHRITKLTYRTCLTPTVSTIHQIKWLQPQLQIPLDIFPLVVDFSRTREPVLIAYYDTLHRTDIWKPDKSIILTHKMK